MHWRRISVCMIESNFSFILCLSSVKILVNSSWDFFPWWLHQVFGIWFRPSWEALFLEKASLLLEILEEKETKILNFRLRITCFWYQLYVNLENAVDLLTIPIPIRWNIYFAVDLLTTTRTHKMKYFFSTQEYNSSERNRRTCTIDKE